MDEYDQHLDVVEIMRPLHKALDKMGYTWRKMKMADSGVPPYRWSEDQLDRVGDVLDKLRDRFREMEDANKEDRP